MCCYGFGRIIISAPESGISFDTFARWLGYKLGYDFEEQWSDQQLAQQVITGLAGHRYLLVLDNLETLQQDPALWQPYQHCLVLWLSAANQSCLLLTTQQRLDLPGSQWEWAALAGLSVEQGVALLRQYGVEGETADLEKFVRLADRHPLLLTLAANTLVRQAKRDQDAASILRLQHDALGLFRQITDLHRGDPTASVGAVLDISYQRLPAQLQTLMRRVSVYRLAAFDQAMAQAMLPETPIAEADLRRLADCSFLLEQRQADRRWQFSFQPLIQRYCQQVLQETAAELTAHQRIPMWQFKTNTVAAGSAILRKIARRRNSPRLAIAACDSAIRPSWPTWTQSSSKSWPPARQSANPP